MEKEKSSLTESNSKEFFQKKVFFTSKKISIGSLKEIFMAKYVSNKSEPI